MTEFPIVRKIEKEVEHLGHRVKAEVTFIAEYHPKVWSIIKKVYIDSETVWQRERGVGGIPFEELPEVRKSEEELKELLQIGIEAVERRVREERREKALAELWRMVWSRPFGFTSLSEVPPELLYDEEEVKKKFVNRFIDYAIKTSDMTPDGRYYVYRPRCFRAMGPVILYHKDLVDKPLVGVRVEKTVKGTAWKILPGGNYVVLAIQGSYMSRGKWAPSIQGFFIEEVYVSERDGAIILWNARSMSSGGGLGETLLIVALPMTLSRPIMLAKGLVTSERWTRREDVKTWYLFSNGIAVDDLSILEP